jgi:hypothetical protein
LEDELSICLVFAFDEIATYRSYVDDYPFYDRCSAPQLGRWIRHVARDECLHFTNFVRLVRENHAERVCECGNILDEILAYDRSAEAYFGTFVLDHSGPQFTDEFLEDCASRLKLASGQSVQAAHLSRALGAGAIE